jgi:hypothetical protein
VRITHASPLITEQLRLTRLEEFLEEPERPRPQLVMTENQAAVA